MVNKRQSVAASDSTGACRSINSVRTPPEAGEVGPEGLVYRTGLGTGCVWSGFTSGAGVRYALDFLDTAVKCISAHQSALVARFIFEAV